MKKKPKNVKQPKKIFEPNQKSNKLRPSSEKISKLGYEKPTAS